MSDDLIFLMGKYEAVLPGELRYARNHMWCRAMDGRLRFGFTSYAVRLMQDVYFLEWTHSDGAAVKEYEQIGHIETSKLAVRANPGRGAHIAAVFQAFFFRRTTASDGEARSGNARRTGWLTQRLFSRQQDRSGNGIGSQFLGCVRPFAQAQDGDGSAPSPGFLQQIPVEGRVSFKQLSRF